MTSIPVVYFSATGTTEAFARSISSAVNGTLVPLKPSVPYTPGDLDWTNPSSRSSLEMKDLQSRPSIEPVTFSFQDCSTFFLGFPIWWYVAPTLINTFLESSDFTGKRILLFATSGISGFGETVARLLPSASGADFVEGRVLHGKRLPADVDSWAQSQL